MNNTSSYLLGSKLSAGEIIVLSSIIVFVQSSFKVGKEIQNKRVGERRVD